MPLQFLFLFKLRIFTTDHSLTSVLFLIQKFRNDDNELIAVVCDLCKTGIVSISFYQRSGKKDH